MAPQRSIETMLESSSSSNCSLDEQNDTVMIKGFASLSLEVSYPKHLQTDREQKSWVLEHYREALLDAMTLKLPQEQQHPVCDDLDQEEQDEQENIMKDTLPLVPTTTKESSPSTHPEESIQKRFELLDKVAHVQANFLQSEGPKVVYTCLLNGILELMQSEFGFIGEVKYTKDGGNDMYLQTHATTTVGWDKETIQYFHDHPGVVFYNMDSLMGQVLTSKKLVICNDPDVLGNLKLPRGHPGITSFLGIPLFERGGKIIGNICIANKRAGSAAYTAQDYDFLKPFAVTGSNLIQAYWQVEKNKLLIDTLERKVLERTTKLEESNHRLEAANKRVLQASRAQLQQFACLSHEIRTPLNCVIGLSSLLQETILNPQQEEFMRMIVSSGDLLLTVVNDILDFSKLESGAVEIEMLHSSLQEALNSTVHLIETKALAKNIQVHTIFDASVPEFMTTDSRRLQQILYNLLGNSLKFSNEGGVIELAVSTGLYPSRKDDGSEKLYTRFVVKDYGKGIEEKDFEQIFEPFRQASAETERVYGGTGLGLAITAKLVTALGGSISVGSKVGEFTAFTVDLPLGEKRVNVERFTQQLKGVTLFIVDQEEEDSLDNRRLTRILKRFEARCRYFRSMRHLEKHVAIESMSNPSSSMRFVCLIQEDLFDADSYRRVSIKIPSVLATFGPKFSVKETVIHYRSLLKVLPSVLIKSLIESCSGTIQKVGSRYSITNSTSNTTLSSLVDTVPIRDLRILIAEDNIVNQKVLARMLKRLGAENVDIVSNGQEAVDKEAGQKYEVILMDYQMPCMDGITACRRIVNRGEYLRGEQQPPQVVFVTAHAARSYELECQRAGGCGFLSKPFNLNDISKCFQRLHIETFS